MTRKDKAFFFGLCGMLLFGGHLATMKFADPLNSMTVPMTGIVGLAFVCSVALAMITMGDN